MPDRGAALVTGAARRIGRALALAAADAGYDVAVHHRDSTDDAEATATAIREKGVRAEVIAADLSDNPQRLIGQASAALGPVTLLVNNASVFLDDTLETLTREHWDAHMEANLHAPVALTQAFAEQGIEGRVGPGPMALTRMRGLSAWAIVRVAHHRPAFERL